jgi:peptidoglycan/xylan/chitin deacetylase (PgdA/CDA1 family)
MMERMAARGWEVGLHGGYQSFRDADELAREKRSVEGAARASVAGGRQHFLRFDVRRTWAAQARAGIAYDATLGYNEAVGCRAGIAAPFRPWDPDARAAHDLIETPLTVMDGTLFRTLLLGADTAFERTREHLERVESAGGLAVLLWHPNAAAERLFPGWWRSYERTLEWLDGRGAWIAPAAPIASWWREREARATRSNGS